MPQSAPKPCTVCSTLVHDGSARCSNHKAVPWLARPEVKRTAGRQLQKKRAALFSLEPFCRECRKAGKRTLATIRDHVRPLAEGGTDDDSNIQPLCVPCHDTKTAAESARGRGHQIPGGHKVETGPDPLFLRAQVEGVGGVKR